MCKQKTITYTVTDIVHLLLGKYLLISEMWPSKSGAIVPIVSPGVELVDELLVLLFDIKS